MLVFVHNLTLLRKVETRVTVQYEEVRRRGVETLNSNAELMITIFILMILRVRVTEFRVRSVRGGTRERIFRNLLPDRR